MRVDMRRPTPMQSTKTTHSSSFSVSRTPISSTRPKPIVDTAEERTELLKVATGEYWCRPQECRRTTQPDAEQDQKGRVVPGPLVLGLLPVVEVAVDPLRRREQVEHLPQGKLKVHLPEMEQSPQVLVALGASRVTCGIPGARGAVAVWRGGRQHGAGCQTCRERNDRLHYCTHCGNDMHA